MKKESSSTALLDTVPRKQFFAQAAFVTMFSYLTSGVFLSGLGILMGAGDVLISYLSVIINICGVLILFFSVYLERFKSRKKLTIGLTILSRVATLLIVIIPAFIPRKYQLLFFLPIVVIAFTLQAQTTVVLNQWMLHFVDEKKSGAYISLRQTMTLIVTVVFSIVGGWWMDFMQGKYIGFVILFLLALVAGIGDVLLLCTIPDKEVIGAGNSCCKLKELIHLPIKNAVFTKFVVYIFSFYLLLTVADSFTMVYMMKYLELPYRTVTGMYLIISLPQVVFLSMWGKISDKYGHAFALKSSIWLFAGETLFMFFASTKSCYIFIPIAFFIASVANAGFVVAVFNRRYEIMPGDNRILFDNFYTAVIGIGFILGPMIGGLLKGGMEHIEFIDKGITFGSIRALYLISTIGILVLQIVYGRISKKEDSKTCRV